jgi:hypothetical protein
LITANYREMRVALVCIYNETIADLQKTSRHLSRKAIADSTVVGEVMPEIKRLRNSVTRALPPINDPRPGLGHPDHTLTKRTR